MPIPDFKSIILPLLKIAGDKVEHHRRIVVNDLASHFLLTDEERNKVTLKRKLNFFDNRCDFALNFLRENGLLRSTRRGSFKITERGLAVLEALNQSTEEIEDAFLKSPAKLIDYLNNRWPIEDGEGKDKDSEESDEDEEGGDSDQTPEESIKDNYQQIRDELAAELLQKIKDNTAAFFEKLVIDLLFKMGYGGSREDAQAVGRSGDGGIDGIIKADPLGLNVVYIQANGGKERSEHHQFEILWGH